MQERMREYDEEWAEDTLKLMGYRGNSEFWWFLSILFAIILGIAGILLMYLPGIFISESSAKRAVEHAGYEQVEIVDKDIFLLEYRGCGKDDSAKFDIIAVSKATGEKVEFYVCGGIFKGFTIRFE